MGNSASSYSAHIGNAIVDPFLIVGMAVLLIILLVINIYTLAYWVHPDDKNESVLARALIVLGLQISSMAVLMIPIDYANNGGDPHCDSVGSGTYCGGIDFTQVWESLFCIIAFVVVVLIPFAIFYYESDDGSLLNKEGKATSSRFCSALAATSVCTIAAAVLLLCLYFFKGTVNEPVDNMKMHFHDMTTVQWSGVVDNTPNIDFAIDPGLISFYSSKFIESTTYIHYDVNFAVYVIALIGWIGWWCFSIFAGIGLASLPFDLIGAFVYRPITLSPDEIHNKELELQERTGELLDISLLLKRERAVFAQGGASRGEKRKRMISDRMEINRLTQMVFILERDVEDFELCKGVKDDQSALAPFFKLFAGILFSIVSLAWLVHIVLYLLVQPAPTGFLNVYLTWFDGWFPMFGDITYAIFALYLLACTIKGCFKFGMRFLCIKIHPMKVGGTFINSFLFNLAVILFCTIPVVHFCTIAFSRYSRFTDAYFIFLVQIAYLDFYGLFYRKNVFSYIIFLCAWITLLYLLYRPRDTAGSAEEFKQKLHRRGAAGYGVAPTSAGGGFSMVDRKTGAGKGSKLGGIIAASKNADAAQI